MNQTQSHHQKEAFSIILDLEHFLPVFLSMHGNPIPSYALPPGLWTNWKYKSYAEDISNLNGP